MGKMTIGQMIAQLGSGMLISTQIFVITLLFSLPLGLVVAFGRMSKNRVISMIVKFYPYDLTCFPSWFHGPYHLTVLLKSFFLNKTNYGNCQPVPVI